MNLTYRQMQVGAARLYFDELGIFCKWNVSLMARIAGLNRSALHRILAQHDIEIPRIKRERCETKAKKLASRFLSAQVISPHA